MSAADALFGIFGMKRVGQPMILNITVPIEVTGTLNSREHYRVRAARVAKEHAAVMRAMPRKPLMMDDHEGARVTLLRPHKGCGLDTDNLAGAFKGVRDEVAAFLGVDDKSERIHWRYVQCPAKRFDVDCGQTKCKSVTGKKAHRYCLKCTANGYDTHIRVRIEIVPAADVDPMRLAVSMLVAAAQALLNGVHEDDAEERIAMREAIVTSTTLAAFDPVEMYR